MYEENAFSITDLFNETLSKIWSETEVKVTALKTLMHGVCFTFSFSEEVQIDAASSFVIKRPWDMTIYFHNEGEEFWLFWYNFPILMRSLRLNINTR